MKSVRKALPFVGLVALGIVAAGGQPLESLAAFLAYLANPLALAVVSSVALQAIKRIWPGVDEGSAFFGSMVLAVGLAIGAMFLLPHVPSLPAEAERLWPFLVWFMQQAWYFLMKDSTVLGVYRRAGA